MKSTEKKIKKKIARSCKLIFFPKKTPNPNPGMMHGAPTKPRRVRRKKNVYFHDDYLQGKGKGRGLHHVEKASGDGGQQNPTGAGLFHLVMGKNEDFG